MGGGLMTSVRQTCVQSGTWEKICSELKLLEPCGMGNPVPKLFQNWFENAWHRNQQDAGE